jgi:aspartokinase/homoserine dehydrogenase 1
MRFFSVFLASAVFSAVNAFVPNLRTPVSSRRETKVSISVAANKEFAISEDIVSPKGSENKWEVHKFGGASLATADLYKTVGDLLMSEASGRGDSSGAIPTMAIVSARGGMTDLLVKVVDSALIDLEEARKVLSEAVEGQIELLGELAPPEITATIEANIRNDANDILLLVQSLRMINTVPAVTMEVVSGYGEIW